MTRYLNIYLTEAQAETLRRFIDFNTTGLADSNPLKAIQRRIEKAQAEADASERQRP